MKLDYYLVAYRIAELRKKRGIVVDWLHIQCLHHFQMGTDKMHSHRPQEDGCSPQLDCTLLGNAISINRCSLNPSSRMTVEKLSPHTRHREMCSTTVFEFNLNKISLLNKVNHFKHRRKFTLVVIKISSRFITPSRIFDLTALPISASFLYKNAVSMWRYPASIASLTACPTSPDDVWK